MVLSTKAQAGARSIRALAPEVDRRITGAVVLPSGSCGCTELPCRCACAIGQPFGGDRVQHRVLPVGAVRFVGDAIAQASPVSPKTGGAERGRCYADVFGWLQDLWP